MMLAGCIARAYEKEPKTYRDAAGTASVLGEWTLYDAENAPPKGDRLLRRYLDRNYHHPLVEYKGVEFGLLKCLDMYHSKELDAHVKRFVSKPNWVTDKPPPN